MKCQQCGKELLTEKRLGRPSEYCSDACRKQHRKTSQKESEKKWRLTHPEKIKEAQTRWRQANAQRIYEVQKAWRLSHQTELREYAKNRYQTNPKVKAGIERWQQEHVDEIRERKKHYREAHRQERRAYNKQWAKDNPEKAKEARRRQRQRAWRNNIQNRLANSLRVRVRKVLFGRNKSAPTMELLGCTLEFLKKHLERQWKSGMTWDNYGDWQIDHIVPCSAFDLVDSKQQRTCFHWSNLQPLWAKENMKKRTRTDGQLRLAV